MKNLAVLLLILSTHANASENAASQCLNKISEDNSFPTITATALTCMKAKFTVDEVTPAVSGLCSKNEKAPSAKYLKYREYQTKLNSLWEKYAASTDTAEQSHLQYQMSDLERNWSISGNRDEVAGYLNALASTLDGCVKN